MDKTTKTNDLDGKVSVVLKKSDIIIRCTQGKRADSYWNPGNAGFVGPLGSMPDTQVFFPSDGERVRWRIDNGPLHSENWSASEDNHALFFPSRDLTEWEKGRSLVLEYREFEKTSDTVTIDISGLKESLLAHHVDSISNGRLASPVLHPVLDRSQKVPLLLLPERLGVKASVHGHMVVDVAAPRPAASTDEISQALGVLRLEEPARLCEAERSDRSERAPTRQSHAM